MAKKETTKKKTTAKKKTVEKKEEPVVITQNEQEVIPTVEDAEKAIDTVNVEAEIVAPVEEIKPEDPAEEEPTPDVKKVVHHTENKPKKNIVSRIFGYLWNGQEMDI